MVILSPISVVFGISGPPPESTCRPGPGLLTAGAAQADGLAMTDREPHAFGTRILDAAFGARYRPTRVSTLLAGVVILSLGDLYMTLVHLLNFGMFEGNPVARGIMAHGSPAMLIIWKLVTVGFAVAVMFWARRRISAEAGALFCCLVLTWLTLQWAHYSDQVANLTNELHAMDNESEVRWVTMAPDPS